MGGGPPLLEGVDLEPVYEYNHGIKAQWMNMSQVGLKPGLQYSLARECS